MYIHRLYFFVFSALLYLNDDFLGGDFIFANHKSKIQVSTPSCFVISLVTRVSMCLPGTLKTLETGAEVDRMFGIKIFVLKKIWQLRPHSLSCHCGIRFRWLTNSLGRIIKHSTA